MRSRSISTATSRETLGASLSATGTVISRNDARISSEVGGTLAWIAEPGSVVKRGEAIARIDVERLQLALRDNEAALRRFEAQLSLLATQRARLESRLLLLAFLPLGTHQVPFRKTGTVTLLGTR